MNYTNEHSFYEIHKAYFRLFFNSIFLINKYSHFHFGECSDWICGKDRQFMLIKDGRSFSNVMNDV